MLKAVVDTASVKGIPLYLVGGSVRDSLLDRPIKDLDLVVEGDATDLATDLSEKYGERVSIHSRFGTATISLQGRRIDLATARREAYVRPGALPEVVPGTLEEDLARRDFSVNAMALALSGPDEGTLIDLHGGKRDLDAGLIRVLHPGSFVDDPTRVLRALRYEQRLAFQLEEKTHHLLEQTVDNKGLTSITGDRIRREMELIFLEDQPSLALARAMELGALRTVYLPLERAEFGAFRGLSTDHDPLIYLAALAYRLEPYEGEVLISRLYMPGIWSTVVRETISIRKGMEIDWVDLPHGELSGRLDQFSTTPIKASAILSSLVVQDLLRLYLKEMRQVKPVLGGDDLIAMGFAPGPVVGEVLRDLRSSRIEGKVTTREDEMRLAQHYLDSKGG